ncbi:MAG TPA: hypothetical protein PKX76_00170 [Flexilinea sp.]|nr:hypothetical protein [Flexilinea sp.]
MLASIIAGCASSTATPKPTEVPSEAAPSEAAPAEASPAVEATPTTQASISYSWFMM